MCRIPLPWRVFPGRFVEQPMQGILHAPVDGDSEPSSTSSDEEE